MTLVITFENGTATTVNVSKSFTMKLAKDCFLNKDYKSMGIVTSVKKSSVTIY